MRDADGVTLGPSGVHCVHSDTDTGSENILVSVQASTSVTQ